VVPAGAERDQRDGGAEEPVVVGELGRGQATRQGEPGGADEEERQVGGDVPEVRDAEECAGVREAMVGRVLRDRVEQESGDDCADGDERDEGESQDLPTTS
jgi:hypothetical protein